MSNSSNCLNFGVANGTSCACPVGFGGPTCGQPACGGNIFQGSSRPLAPISGNLANLSAASCSCEDGWTGVGCNVCQTAKACQAAFASVSPQGSISSSADLGASTGLNDTLTCNSQATVYTAGEMSCQVNNPTLQALYPLSSTLNVLRTLNNSLTPLPNTTGFGPNGSLYAQLFYDGEEQFYCTANSCTQQEGSDSGSSDWTCQNLQCQCIANSTFCGQVPATDLSGVLNTLSGALEVSCDAPSPQNNTANCAFKQQVINQVFGSAGLSLTGCTFGECVAQDVIDTTSGNSTTSSDTSHGTSLSGGVIGGLAVVCSLIALALAFLLYGWLVQRRARRSGYGGRPVSFGGVTAEWTNLSYFVPSTHGNTLFGGLRRRRHASDDLSDHKVVLDDVSGRLEPGQMMAILGPSGAGKTTLIEILAGKNKTGRMAGSVTFHSRQPRVGFVSQQDVLPPTLTVYEALLVAAELRIPENVPITEKRARVDDVIDKLGLTKVRDVRIGDGEKRGISGGEMRRVSIGLELVALPDVLILDEPTSGLDSVSAAKVTKVLHAVAHDEQNPTVVIASVHQPSSQLYHSFDQVLLLSHGRALYSGPGGFAPATYFAYLGVPYLEGYNVADYLLEIASDPPVLIFQAIQPALVPDTPELGGGLSNETLINDSTLEKGYSAGSSVHQLALGDFKDARPGYATTFLTQLEVLSGREWKILRRDLTLFFTHIAVACVLGVFVGGLYFKTGITIAGFQSRVGCLFFLGALIAFSTLSALYHIIESRPLFLRERSARYYGPTAWLLSRFIFDVVPLRIIPTIVVSTITYWMAGLAPDATHFFKFLLILVLYTLAMTLFNFLLACWFNNGGVAILLSALTALYQMTFAGFFVNLGNIPQAIRWLQWLCPLKFTLEALSVNEVGSGLMIQDTLQGVPVDLSASLVMDLLFDFGPGNYSRDVLVLFGFGVGFAVSVILVVTFHLRERR
ncbi:uncharacterized protein PHACADRAFT_122183 [Phanerochaete carnosa HHB-10118-sp]|uniref:ABC transporter domain-containing protein n=1 Tax=Phanerochaete carnosa (strain HHB-10118-sp) TaxID=650164 RepID=K5WA09_PHACS|nr:uncharacterized protein PHACADRAFT_122183 [Phanerochaete carnosa HHB-10118-sp]EKM56050.1 hypothetical protein PHACADRAFT_122183 [Phanerochaete carnosa HHB-10118-sp]